MSGSEETKPTTTGLLPASHWKSLNVEEDDHSDASSFASSNASSTTSLRDSILEYRKILGRTYHHELGDAENWTPNDDKHTESMELVHYLTLVAMKNKLFHAPLDTDKLKKVLDVGTGTGHWAIDFGDQYPNVEVTGTDITPIQPSWTPPNVSWEIDDANQDWTWPENTFDFIHVRYLMGCIRNWKKFYQDAFRCLKPGGWLEHHESSSSWYSDTEGVGPDHTVAEDSPVGQAVKIFQSSGERIGRTFRVFEDELQQKLMKEVGFVDIGFKNYDVPIGSWPEDPEQKQLGILGGEALLGDLEGYMLYVLTKVEGWSEDEARTFTAHVRAQLRKPGFNPYFKRRAVWGRKPE